MPVGQLIALGVGSPSNIAILTLTGLYTSQVSGGGISSGTVDSSVPTVLAGNTIYTTPPRIVNIGWYSAGAAIMEGSIDLVTWFTLDTTVGNTNQVISSVVAPFIRPSAQVTVTVKKKKKL